MLPPAPCTHRGHPSPKQRAPCWGCPTHTQQPVPRCVLLTGVLEPGWERGQLLFGVLLPSREERGNPKGHSEEG